MKEEKNISTANEIKKAYFIGIGGAGMSGIAKVMHEMGIRVSGSDIKESANIKSLKKLGIEVKIGHRAENIVSADVIVSSTAIPKKNPELIYANENNLTVWHRAKALAYVAQKKKTIAVCGTHGKTTTTSMISLLFENLKADPTFLIGGELNDIGSNAKFGKGQWLIAEADESDGSLIHLHPSVLVLTNVEADHLDFFKDYQEIEELFKRFIKQVPDDGIVIFNGDYDNLRSITEVSKAKKVSFGFQERNDFQIIPEENNSSFSIIFKNKKLGRASLKVTGRHNMLNAAAAIATAIELGYEFSKIQKEISNFSGVRRRFEKIPTKAGINIIDDYAHHPTEIKTTLETARKAFDGRIICVFQPHRYSRTKHLKKMFGDSFNGVDTLVLTDIYGAGEYPIPGVTGKLLVDEVIDKGVKNVVYMPTLGNAADYVKRSIAKGDNLITMGAGDVWQVAREVAASIVFGR